MLSRLVITYLPKSKSLLISWLQSPSAVILEPPKIKSGIFITTVASWEPFFPWLVGLPHQSVLSYSWTSTFHDAQFSYFQVRTGIVSVLVVAPRAYTCAWHWAREWPSYNSSYGHLLAPGWSQGRVGASSGPASVSSQPAPFPGPKDAHSLSPRGAGRDGGTPPRSGHSHGRNSGPKSRGCGLWELVRPQLPAARVWVCGTGAQTSHRTNPSQTRVFNADFATEASVKKAAFSQKRWEKV